MTWRTSKAVDLDSLPYAERRVRDLQLCLVWGRQWPQYYTPTADEMIERAKDEILPWSYTPDEEFLLCGEEP